MSIETAALPADVEFIFGPVGEEEFRTAADWAKPKLIEWARQLQRTDDNEFLGEAAAAIHGSAVANRFRGNWNHEHCKTTVAFREARRRHVAAGHADDCRGDTLYSRAFAQVWRSQGHGPSAYPARPCDCRSA